MKVPEKLKHEIKALGWATLFFGTWISTLLLLKTLVLEEYEIGFSGWTKAVAGTLILAKVVLILEHVSLGSWIKSQPAWVDLLLRTSLYSAGVALVFLLEQGLEDRHELGGFIQALRMKIDMTSFPHLLLNVICLSGALFTYNALTVIRRRLGRGGLLHLFFDKPASGQESPLAPDSHHQDGLATARADPKAARSRD